MLKNNFSIKTKNFYIDNELWMCCLCGEVGSEPHHIMGRGREEYASIYNSALLCRRCHNRHDIHSKNIQSRLLHKTKDVLTRYNYVPNKLDIRFNK